MNQVRVRIAPSPTGEDLHIGNVYTALINYIFAKKHKGMFIVRIEDTDRERIVEYSEKRILESLNWLGLNYNEGPDIGGSYGPYRQSDRLKYYQEYAQNLIEKRHAYYCFCSPQRLDEMRKKQQLERKPTLYDGFCKKYSLEEAREKAKKEKYVIRLNVPDEGVTEFNDLIRGKITFENKLIDDQILLKSDGFPTYHLAVVIDDNLMKISHVIRAEDWISSTPKHVLLYKYFEWKLPIYVHGPLLRNPDRSKLSKRKNPVWVSWYKEQGFLPEAILNYLALMGWSMPEEKELFSLEEMIQNFQLEDIKPVGPAFDIKKLEWLNGEYIRKSQISNLKSQIYKFINGKYPEDLIGKTIPLIQERIKKLSDYLPLCEFIFEEPQKYEIDLSSKKDVMFAIFDALQKLGEWKAELIGISMQEVAKKLGMKNSEFFMLLRVAMTGKKISPPLNESMEILGKEEVVQRIFQWVK